VASFYFVRVVNSFVPGLASTAGEGMGELFLSGGGAEVEESFSSSSLRSFAKSLVSLLERHFLFGRAVLFRFVDRGDFE